MGDRVFFELQRFRPWWLWIFVLAPGIPLVVSALSDLLFYFSERHETSAHATGALIVLPIWAAFSAFIVYGFSLFTRIDDQGISVKYRPFSSDYVHFAWREIDQVFLRSYDALGEYGGWGWQRRWPPIWAKNIVWGKNCNISYTVSGNEGLQLVLTDGSRILIGTKDAAGIGQALQAFGRA